MPGTAAEREAVAADVASDLDAMGVDELRTALAEERERSRTLESNIGRQNNVQGERIKQLESRFETEMEKIRREKREAEERVQRVYYNSLSPSEKTAAKLQALENKVEAQERRDREQAYFAEQARQIDVVVEKARQLGYDTTKISRTDVQEALADLGALEQDAVKAELAELKKKMKDQEDGIVEAVTAASGRRTVTTGSPSSVKANATMDPEERRLRSELEQARKLKGQAASTAVLAVKIEASRLGIDLS